MSVHEFRREPAYDSRRRYVARRRSFWPWLICGALLAAAAATFWFGGVQR